MRVPCKSSHCIHTCTLYCQGGEHCDIVYSSEDAEPEWIRLFLAARYVDSLWISKVERAAEAGPCPNDKANHPHPFAYLVWFTGCPMPCPNSEENALLLPEVQTVSDAQRLEVERGIVLNP